MFKLILGCFGTGVVWVVLGPVLWIRSFRISSNTKFGSKLNVFGEFPVVKGVCSR